ncbi:hypothetical protein ABKN59_005911 [Abortiporus biennis]
MLMIMLGVLFISFFVAFILLCVIAVYIIPDKKMHEFVKLSNFDDMFIPLYGRISCNALRFRTAVGAVIRWMHTVWVKQHRFTPS